MCEIGMWMLYMGIVLIEVVRECAWRVGRAAEREEVRKTFKAKR